MVQRLPRSPVELRMHRRGSPSNLLGGPQRDGDTDTWHMDGDMDIDMDIDIDVDIDT